MSQVQQDLWEPFFRTDLQNAYFLSPRFPLTTPLSFLLGSLFILAMCWVERFSSYWFESVLVYQESQPAQSSIVYPSAISVTVSTIRESDGAAENTAEKNFDTTSQNDSASPGFKRRRLSPPEKRSSRVKIMLLRTVTHCLSTIIMFINMLLVMQLQVGIFVVVVAGLTTGQFIVEYFRSTSSPSPHQKNVHLRPSASSHTLHSHDDDDNYGELPNSKEGMYKDEVDENLTNNGDFVVTGIDEEGVGRRSGAYGSQNEERRGLTVG